LYSGEEVNTSIDVADGFEISNVKAYKSLSQSQAADWTPDDAAAGGAEGGSDSSAAAERHSLVEAGGGDMNPAAAAAVAAGEGGLKSEPSKEKSLLD
jgi:hypothetical protein